ncbi:hypothetical protein ACP3WA_26795, partial [Salmonella enterica]|uniref:hypothetical protein n=1 Tax=Salmonella enterica TaxID=28901 RepID=UPI003CF20381
LLLVPHLGMIRTGFMFGIANAAVAIALLMVLPAREQMRLEKFAAWAILLFLAAGFVASERVQRWAEVAAYQEPV